MKSQVLASKYKVEDKLGEGSYGSVYLVRHIDLGLLFAMKILKAGRSTDAQIVERFKKEAGILLRFNHAGTSALRDFGRTEDGAYYMVTDFCEGYSLEDILATKKRISVIQALEVTVQILKTLEAAHALQIIHRDIKSANVMLVEKYLEHGEPTMPPPGQIQVRVLDFGIAKLQEDLTSVQSSSTLEGVSVGTPTYMSPEQAAGEADLDHRVDVYAAGILLYELLSGDVPFAGQTVVQTLLKHLTQPPPPFPDDLEIPAEVEAAVRKALEKEKDKRFQSAEAFRNACEALLADLTKAPAPKETHASPVKREERPLKAEGADFSIEGVRRILCLDDNEMILEIMRHLLEREGYEVFTASNFSVIHDFIFKEHVALMLCDVQMPGLPGNKICQMLKQALPQMKIVLFSNIPDRELEKLSLEAKADAWMSKNSKPEVWLKRIKELSSPQSS